MSARPSAPRGVLLAGVGAVAALTSLWLPWYTMKFPQAFRDALGAIGGGGSKAPATGSGAAGSGADLFSGLFKGLAAALPSEITGKGWQVMSGGDVAIAVAAGAALLLIVAVGGGASGVRIERGIAGRLIALAGAVVAAIAVQHVVSKPGGTGGGFSSMVEVKYGIAVAAAGGLLMIIGGLLTARPAPAEAAEPITPTFEPPQPAAVPDPFAAPAPEPEEHTVSDPFAAPTPDPFADPVPEPRQAALDPFVDPQAEPHAQAEPEHGGYVIETEPEVVLDRDPFADPEPVSEPQVVLDRDPFADPEPVSEPQIVLDRDPDHAAEPQVVLDSEPFVAPEAQVAPDPEPFAQPDPAPVPVAHTDPFADPGPAPEPVADSVPAHPADEPRDWSGFTTPVPEVAAEPAAVSAAATPSAPRPAGVSIPPPGWTGAA